MTQARAARRAGDTADSLDLYRKALAATGDATERAHCLRHIGDITPDDAEARAVLAEAERLYRGPVSDALGLANTVRLIALRAGDPARWREARGLYEIAAAEGWDLAAALAECDRQLA